jgi:hypothetical protein
MLVLDFKKVLVFSRKYAAVNDAHTAHQVMKDKMGRACSTHAEMKNAYRILARRPEGKRQLERTRGRREDNTKMDFR